MREFMIDIETLDTTANAVVLSIGAVRFGDEGAYPDGFKTKLQVDEQFERGRSASFSTLAFWAGQPGAFRKELSGERCPVEVGLFHLRNLLTRAGIGLYDDNFVLWAKGADFDVRVLDGLYRQFRLTPPWRYNAARDLRTLIHEAARLGAYESPVRDLQRLPVHDALADCVFQVQELQAARDHLRHGRLA